METAVLKKWSRILFTVCSKFSQENQFKGQIFYGLVIVWLYIVWLYPILSVAVSSHFNTPPSIRKVVQT